MDGVRGARTLQLFNCTHANCGATFTRQWRLKEHETVHTGAVRESVQQVLCHLLTLILTLNCSQRPCQCAVAGCGRRFSRKSHLSRHMLQHRGVKQFKWVRGQFVLPPPPTTHWLRCSFCRCKVPACNLSFFNAGKLKRHVRYHHEDKNKYFKVCQCPLASTRWRQAPRHDGTRLHVNVFDV